MFRQPPQLPYCGLTLILSKPSRFDTQTGKLLSGFAGQVFKRYLHPLLIESIDIQVATEPVELLPGTRLVLLLGDEALSRHYPVDVKMTLNDARGNPVVSKINNIVYIASYGPQDAQDLADYESGSDDDDSDSADDGDVKGHGVTKRRNWSWWLRADVLKAKRLLKMEVSEILTEEPIEVKIYPSAAEICEHLKSIKNDRLILDIETKKRQELTCIGLSFASSNLVYVIPWSRYDGTYAYGDIFLRRIIQALCVAMGSNTVVCHNACFDLLVLCWKYKIPIPKDILDTMLIWHRCYPELEKSLGHLISYFLNRPYHKSEGIYSPKTPQQEIQLYNYNAKDIITTRQILKPLLAEAEKLGSAESATWACRMVRPYLTATLRGLRTDVAEFKARYADLEVKRQQINRCLGFITKRPEMNIRSHQQVSEYLYKSLNLHCPDDKKPTAAKTLLRLLAKNKVPSIKLILLSKKSGKLASSMKFRLWKDLVTGEYNRYTCAYNIAGTDSFRLGSRAVFKYKRGDDEAKLGYGTNLQNQKKEQRTLIKADIGYKLGQRDQSGAEALIVAYLCRHGKFRELFIHGVKPHVFVALHVFADKWRVRISNPSVIDILLTLSPADLKSHPSFKEVDTIIKDSDNWPASQRYYFIAKMICHASNYGMKFPTFQINVLEKSEGAVELSTADCKKFLEYYHKLFPEIEDWHRRTQQQLLATRTLKNLFGEPRIFNGHFDDNTFKSAYAFVPQSTVGQITNYAYAELQELCDQGGTEHHPVKNWGFHPLQNNHDSILYQNFPEFEKQAGDLVGLHLAREMVSPVDGTIFRMKTELQVGYNWCPFKKEINPQGLIEVK